MSGQELAPVKKKPASRSALIEPALAAARVIAAAEKHIDPEGTALEDVLPDLLVIADDVVAGDMAEAERMLVGQAKALETLFTSLVERALQQTHMPMLDMMMRLALRAQNQSRMTLETLSTVKNPPASATFIKQQNVAGGPQQVNNGAHPITPAPAPEAGSWPHKLLEKQHDLLDAGATRAASGKHRELEAVGAIHRPEDGER